METTDQATSQTERNHKPPLVILCQKPSAGMHPIDQFAIKIVIVAAAVVVSAWILLDRLNYFAHRRMQQVERTLQSATTLGGRQFWTGLENQLDQLADPGSDLPPEKKAKILAQIKVVADRWRPFLREATDTIEGEPEKSAK